MTSRIVSLGLLLAVAAACGKKKETAIRIQTAPVERRDIVIDAEATGAVEPITIVEVKSKASGLITKMPVETGTNVKPGDLLVQVDTRDVQNQYDQALAAAQAARAKLTISSAQKKRADELYATRVITATEHEAAQLDYANSQSAVVRANTDLDLAKQRLEDATVRAPLAGTVIEKTVSEGTVITSATGAFGGGTTLLKMADLSKVRVRALVNETDIGTVRPGQVATVTVDAYPDRPFQGTVEKIEPEAVVQQSVTMFPVLVSLSNREGLLKPGMNGEVSVLIDKRAGVLAVPNDAVRTPREAAQVASILGLNPDSVQAQLAAQRGGGGGMAGPAIPGDTARRVIISNGDVVPSGQQQGGPQQGGQQQGGMPNLPQVTDKDCAAVAAAFTRHPAAQTQLDSLRAHAMSGDLDRQVMRDSSQKIYASLGVDGRVAMACRFRARQAQGGAASAGGSASGSASGGQRWGGADAGGAGGSGSRPRMGLVFVANNGSYAPRIIRLGMANYDYTEVVSGLKEGDQVALLAAAALQAQRQAQQDRIRGMTGGAVPGMQRAPTGGAAAGAGAGGARPGGGGGGGGGRVP